LEALYLFNSEHGIGVGLSRNESAGVCPEKLFSMGISGLLLKR